MAMLLHNITKHKYHKQCVYHWLVRILIEQQLCKNTNMIQDSLLDDAENGAPFLSYYYGVLFKYSSSSIVLWWLSTFEFLLELKWLNDELVPFIGES